MKKLLLIFVLMLAMAGFTKAQVIADFESGTSPFVMHSMANGHLDTVSSNFAVVDNPNASGINTSTKVVKFTRAFDGNPWAGFWTTLPTPLDVTTNKYIHVKVYKPRISPIKFKLEGGTAGNLEIFSKYPQTVVNGWEDMVFDFSSKTGTYPTFSFMPDFEDPLTLTNDTVMYFDDIVLNNESMPASDTTISLVNFRVNMSQWRDQGTFNPLTQFVDIAGSFNGWGNGSSAYHLIPDAADSIYSITVPLITGQGIQFKFRINGSWADSLSEFPGGGPNRTFTVGEGTNVYNCWFNVATTSPAITLGVNMSYWESKGLFDHATQYVDIAGNFTGWGKVIYKLYTTDNKVYKTTFVPDSLFTGDVIQFKFRINGDWNNSEFPGGGPNRSYTISAGINDTIYWYNDSIPANIGIPEMNLNNYVSVYPNPFNTSMFINMTTDINQIIISNYIGQQVARFENLKSGSISVNTSDLKKGMYLVTFFAKDGSKYTQKLIKN